MLHTYMSCWCVVVYCAEFEKSVQLLQVGNFRVEPPGLFRGRGEHPKVVMFFILYLDLMV